VQLKEGGVGGGYFATLGREHRTLKYALTQLVPWEKLADAKPATSPSRGRSCSQSRSLSTQPRSGSKVLLPRRRPSAAEGGRRGRRR
jgi:hypothetical protein